METPCTDMICNNIEYRPKPYSDILFRTAWIYFIASVYGLHKQKYDLAIYTGIVWLTSLNYWNNPNSQFNCYLDMLVVKTGILYHLIRAPDSPNYMTFYSIFNTGLLCYIPSRYFFKKNIVIATISHAGLHLITGAGLIYLYSTKVKPLSTSYLLKYVKHIDLITIPCIALLSTSSNSILSHLPYFE